MTSPETASQPRVRCSWCGTIEDYCHYHDHEWGFPVDDDRRLFEKLCLEGFQSGLSWLTILRKRENFRKAFANFEIDKVARFTARDVERLLGDAGIIRHRGKIEAAIHNARCAHDLLKTEPSLAAYFWKFEPDPKSRPRKVTPEVLRELTTSPESVALSKDLKKRGWKFVGPTTMYALMQAMGLVNDHHEGCATRAEVLKARKAFKVPR
ncbi:DNA-3-methyladenine glycosylase 1 [compost metagenome]|uniref:DNA-3-methyladenine glycosylase I n=1 Tax=Cupriavidus campinensis TaxID=151783 RepID=A0AAE9I0E4_9BURK|nr:DNA-3-methyladenine glycosylase I [Cupriavidus campinensis]URF04055.1 DNA-3-methyladenine glycosylase I [Cupriavidus campinensis]CAG2148456.1 DNA-3-methyladenine glycosylase 1 [Cupriavidus campinensis]